MFRFFAIFFIVIKLLSFEIKNYLPINGCIIDTNSTLKVAIREFSYKDTNYYLVVDPNTLNSSFKVASNIYPCPKELNTTRYYKLLDASISNPLHPLQNDGIVGAKSGIYLSTDLCPSSKSGFEERLYKAIIKKFQNPVPLTLFITKKWITKHKEAFEKLKEWEKEKKLNINWGNHTAKHIYHKNIPLNKNFALSKEEHLIDDILELEVTLIEEGLIPSVFFRFPGLVSNKETISLVKELGLITIGSNAWLAKGQNIKDGSIILLHGNKNEPKGVDIFLKFINESNITKLDDLKNLDIHTLNAKNE